MSEAKAKLASIGADARAKKLAAEKAANDVPRTVKLVSAADLAEPLPPVDFLVSSLGIGDAGLVLVAGYGFTGKTMAWQSAALSFATGAPLWGIFGVRRGRALHIDFEQGLRTTTRRYQRLAEGMGRSLRDIGDGLRVAVHPEVRLDSHDAEDVYSRLFEGVDFVLVDSLRAGAPSADENSSEIRKYLDLLARAAQPHGTIVAVIHHASKPKADAPEGAKYKIRGSGAIFDAFSSVFVFSAEKGHPTNVDHEKCRNRGRLVDSFGLRVESDGDPDEGPIRVVHLDRGQMMPSSGDMSFVRVAAKVEAFFRGLPGATFQGPKHALRKRIGGKTADVGAAISEMVSQGRILVENDSFRLVEPREPSAEF